MSIVTDAIAEFSVGLTRVVPAPTGDLGFGSDLSCTDDITQDAVEVAGDSPLAVAEANYRRLTTARGSMPDDPNEPEPGIADYGLDIVGMLNKGVTAQTLVELPGQIAAELQKDDRNDPGTIQVKVDLVGKVLNVDVRGETAGQPFSLTFAVVDGKATLQQITGEGAL